MGAQRSASVAYGAPIDVEAPGFDWWDLPEAGEVISVGFGEYGGPKRYLLVVTSTLEDVTTGSARMVGPYQAASEPYLTWDAKIVATAEELGVPLTDQPGWVFLCDEN